MKKIRAIITDLIIKVFNPLSKPRMLLLKTNFQGIKIENCTIGNTTFIDYQNKLILHHNTYIGHHNYIEASNEIEIGEGCQITNFVNLTTHSSHISIRLYGNQYKNHSNHIGYLKGSIYIGKYSFIGPHSVIMPNTHIGKGSIVSAFSYVKGIFPDYSIIAGTPAIVIGDTRNKDEEFLNANPELLIFYNNWNN